MTQTARADRPEAPDNEVLARIAAGNLDALGLHFERYQHDVRRFLTRLGASAANLDDLVQQTFLAVIPASQTFDGRYSSRAWLLGIAAKMVRRQRRSIARRLARLGAWGVARNELRPDTPAETFEGREVEDRFWNALEGLSEKKREVFVLVALEGQTGEEAALSLGIPLNTVWTRLHHAREELRRQLRREES